MLTFIRCSFLNCYNSKQSSHFNLSITPENHQCLVETFLAMKESSVQSDGSLARRRHTDHKSVNLSHAKITTYSSGGRWPTFGHALCHPESPSLFSGTQSPTFLVLLCV
jgi:hypothetical protein